MTLYCQFLANPTVRKGLMSSLKKNYGKYASEYRNPKMMFKFYLTVFFCILIVSADFLRAEVFTSA
jgi:hypothetical protein